MTDKAAEKDISVPLEKAVEALKTYVQWFVGPDLAKKVTDKTVKPLADDDKDKDKDSDEDKYSSGEVYENHFPFIKFS